MRSVIEKLKDVAPAYALLAAIVGVIAGAFWLAWPLLVGSLRYWRAAPLVLICGLVVMFAMELRRQLRSG